MWIFFATAVVSFLLGFVVAFVFLSATTTIATKAFAGVLKVVENQPGLTREQLDYWKTSLKTIREGLKD